jgi:hypothetical protein
MAALPIPFLQSRNVLLIGDEGITIYKSSARNIRYIDQIDWVTPDFESKLTHVLTHDCGGGAVVMLYDMVEQYYRKELIPDVGILDKKNVLDRKLAITFPNYKYRAAQAFRGKVKKGAGAGGDQAGGSLKTLPYLFAAVPASELLSALIRAVLAANLPIQGFYLLPIEGASLISRLTKRLYSSGEAPGWTLYIGQHSGGNLRQIIVKDDQLTLTRMTPFSQSQEDPAAWVANILQEYKVTASYLSRLGYKPEDRLNIVLIGPKAAQTILEEQLQESVELKVLSLQEATRLAGVGSRLNQTEEYADALFAAWAGVSSGYALPVEIPEFQRVMMPRRVANIAILFLLLASIWFGYKFAVQGLEAMDLQSKLNANKVQVASLQSTYNQLLDTHKELGYDVRLFRGAFNVWDELNAFSLRPFSMIKGVGLALGEISLEEFSIRHDGEGKINLKSYVAAMRSQDNPNAVSDFASFEEPEEKGPYGFYARMAFRFSPDVEDEDVNNIVYTLLGRLRSALPQYEISKKAYAPDRAYDLDMKGSIGRQTDQAPEMAQENVTIIEIRGAI